RGCAEEIRILGHKSSSRRTAPLPSIPFPRSSLGRALQAFVARTNRRRVDIDQTLEQFGPRNGSECENTDPIGGMMKPISRFVGTTILGGVLFLTPIVVLGFVLSKAFDIVRRGLKPLTALIPDTLASGPSMTTAILAIIILALL